MPYDVSLSWFVMLCVKCRRYLLDVNSDALPGVGMQLVQHTHQHRRMLPCCVDVRKITRVSTVKTEAAGFSVATNHKTAVWKNRACYKTSCENYDFSTA
jgi:hypothetical protein